MYLTCGVLCLIAGDDADTGAPDTYPIPAPRRNPGASAPIATTKFDKHDADTIATKEGMKIVLKRGTLASEQVCIYTQLTGFQTRG